jgi:hypothetical protein
MRGFVLKFSSSQARIEMGILTVMTLFSKQRQPWISFEDTFLIRTMDILRRHFPNKDHVFIFNNATTHTKCAEDALSARKMPKYCPSLGKNWGISIIECDASEKVTYEPNGKPKKSFRQMASNCHG